jgi:hypothetical protein
LRTVVLKKDETLVICIKQSLTQDELESFVDTIPQKLGDKVVFIGDVDKIIVA